MITGLKDDDFMEEIEDIHDASHLSEMIRTENAIDAINTLNKLDCMYEGKNKRKKVNLSSRYGVQRMFLSSLHSNLYRYVDCST